MGGPIGWQRKEVVAAHQYAPDISRSSLKTPLRGRPSRAANHFHLHQKLEMNRVLTNYVDYSGHIATHFIKFYRKVEHFAVQQGSGLSGSLVAMRCNIPKCVLPPAHVSSSH